MIQSLDLSKVGFWSSVSYSNSVRKLMAEIKNEPLSIKDIPFFQRPLGSSENDNYMGPDDGGFDWYENPSTGFRYTVKPQNPGEVRTLRGKLSDLTKQTKEWFGTTTGPKRKKAIDTAVPKIIKAIPGVAKGMLKAVDQDLSDMFSGKATNATLLEYVSGAATTTLPFKAPKGAIRSFGGMEGAVESGALDAVKAERITSLLESSVDNRTLWDAENWWVGPDDLLRYEIDDSAMKWKASFWDNAEDRILRNDSMGEADWITKSEAVEQLQKLNFETLDNLVEHTELFKAYPSLKGLKVYFDDKVESNGVYYPASDTIAINRALLKDPESIQDTLIHEVQHAIQEREGFAQGGDLSLFEKFPEVKKAWVSYTIVRDDYHIKLDVHNNTTYSSGPKKFRAYDLLEKARVNANKAHEKYYFEKFNKYEALYGEEEARAVSNRLRLSKQEKLDMFPEDSYQLSRRTVNKEPSRVVKPQLNEGGAVETSPRPKQRGPEFTGEYTTHGRPVWTLNGERYSEKSMTFEYQPGQWVVAPSIDPQGYEIPQSHVEQTLAIGGPYDPLTGEELRIFKDAASADAYAQERSKNMFNPLWK
jgi:hypothetical protein